MKELISVVNAVTRPICYIYGVEIKRNFIKKKPYVKLRFRGRYLTIIQKELVRRACLDYIYNVEQYDVTTYTNGVDTLKVNNAALDNFLKSIVLSNYNCLCNLALRNNGILTLTYLLSHNIVNIRQDQSIPCALPNLNELEKDKGYYSSFIDENIIKERTDLFPPYSFSQIIKYPDDVINNNFRHFIGGDKPFYFTDINIQKPSFDTLVNHIEEFIVDEPALKTYLSEEEVNQLKLIQSIKGAPH